MNLKPVVSIFRLFAFLCLSILFGTAQAETTQTSVAKSPQSPAWKTSFSSYYYDFQGQRAAKDNLYSFENSTLGLQLLTVEYKINPTLSVFAFAQHLDNYVETNLFGTLYKDRTRGFGDTSISLMKTVVVDSQFFVIGDLGISLPTGSITQKNQSFSQLNYAYNMQLGSGTTDLTAGLMPLYFGPWINAGSRVSTTLRGPFGESTNSQGYKLGQLYKVDAWVDYPTSSGLTPRIVGYYKNKQAISGQDKTLGRSALTEFYHHDQINWDVSAALKYSKNQGSIGLSAELGKALAQNSDNFDDVAVFTDMYGQVSISGQF